MHRRIALAALAVIFAAGCEGAASRVFWGFERMVIQPRYRAFQANPFFADHRAMRRTPDGTIPRGTALTTEAYAAGTTNGVPVDRIPLRLSRPMLERGRERFDIYCAACHGLAGDAVTPVAARMLLRPPVSLHEPRIRAFSPGRHYQVITEGYGLMPSYADVLSIDDRWAVVAYVQALQLSHEARVSTGGAGAPVGASPGRAVPVVPGAGRR